MKTAILYRTHLFNSIVAREYRRLRDDYPEADVFPAIDVTRCKTLRFPEGIRVSSFTDAAAGVVSLEKS